MVKTTTATPGPWAVKRGTEDGQPSTWFDVIARFAYPVGPGETVEIDLPVCTIYTSHGAAEANARLIACAPKLLGLVETARHLALEHPADFDQIEAFLSACDVVLAELQSATAECAAVLSTGEGRP